MTHRRLTPLAELAGCRVTYRPRGGSPMIVKVLAYDPDKRELEVEYPNPNLSPWSPQRTIRSRISTSAGPFRPID